MRGKDGYQDGTGHTKLRITELHSVIRMIPKPVIAAVNGFAIGETGTCCTIICDLSLALGERDIRSDRAARGEFRRTGIRHGVPRAGAWARRRLREMMVPLPPVLGAGERLDMGLVNKVNRPQVRNAFRPLTVDEMIAAFQATHGRTTRSASSS